jgi:glycosyltransferase involved in cell wall biosynthesis
MRHWTINGRFLTQPLTGVQRYAREIIAALDVLLSAGHPLTDGLSIELLIPPNADPDALPLRSIAIRRSSGAQGHLWEQITLPSRAGTGGLLSLCNLGPLNASRQIVCIHDANTRVVPQSYSRSFRTAYRLLVPAVARMSKAVATVSNHSAAELARFGIASRETVVVPNGSEHALRWQPRHSDRTKTAASNDTVVLLGSSIPHKNVGLILDMAGRLRQQGLRIAVVGKPDPRVFHAGQTHDAENIAWLGRVSDDELAALLQDSLCLAFPSLAEGFGLPPLEAMALGCPVVVSDCASLPEICGSAAQYASPHDPDAWLHRFVALHRNPGLRRMMSEQGRLRSRLFSWAQSAKRYLELMAEIDGVATAHATGRSKVHHPTDLTIEPRAARTRLTLP